MTAKHLLDQIVRGLDGVTAGDEIVDALLANKTFVFDPATNFIHADDGGAPEHGIKYVPADLFRDLEERLAKAAEALEPFANVAEHDIGSDETSEDFFAPMERHNRAPRLRVGDLRRARTALSQIRSEK